MITQQFYSIVFMCILAASNTVYTIDTIQDYPINSKKEIVDKRQTQQEGVRRAKGLCSGMFIGLAVGTTFGLLDGSIVPLYGWPLSFYSAYKIRQALTDICLEKDADNDADTAHTAALLASWTGWAALVNVLGQFPTVA